MFIRFLNKKQSLCSLLSFNHGAGSVAVNSLEPFSCCYVLNWINFPYFYQLAVFFSVPNALGFGQEHFEIFLIYLQKLQNHT